MRVQQRVRHPQAPARCRTDGVRSRDTAQAMIGLDTNVLARYYIDDKADAEARRLIESVGPSGSAVNTVRLPGAALPRPAIA